MVKLVTESSITIMGLSSASGDIPKCIDSCHQAFCVGPYHQGGNFPCLNRVGPGVTEFCPFFFKKKIKKLKTSTLFKFFSWKGRLGGC